MFCKQTQQRNAKNSTAFKNCIFLPLYVKDMETLRESISNIPAAIPGVLNFISETASNASNYLPFQQAASPLTTPTSHSTNSGDQLSFPIPASLVKEQWRLLFTTDASAQDLEAAIAHCKDLVLLSEECSEERKWLVRHLSNLRYSLYEMQQAQADVKECIPNIKTVVGHHFAVQSRNVSQVATHCDHCTGIIWKSIQLSYVCKDCNYVAHQKCVDSVVRVCAHVLVSDRQYPILEICPEIGLAAQLYKCAECETPLNFKTSWIEPRLCDYTGLYYCTACHWNDSCIIPARIVHNWDFVPRKVSRVALQEIQLFLNKPLIRLEENNPKLFVFLEKLGKLKKLRQNLNHMRKYLIECRQAITEKLIQNQLENRAYQIQSNEFYSLNDLLQIEDGTLIEFLNKVFNHFDKHIRECTLCNYKAYICEICSNDQVIFPYEDGCVCCDKCNSIYHRVCMTRKNMLCPKCIRLQERRLQLEQKEPSSENEDET